MKNEPGTSRSRAPADASSGSVQESEKRGVTAYLVRPRPCHLSASARPSAYARSGSVNRSSRRIRSESTRPLVTRSPTRSASVNSASTAVAKWDPKTSAVVVPARARPSTKSAATPAAYAVSARRASSGSAQRSSQSSSGMPRPPIARTCG